MSEPTPQKRCKCGKAVLFAVDADGKKQVLDLVAPVYMYEGVNPDGTQRARRVRFAYVSHFATCPAANQFSKGKKAQ